MSEITPTSASAPASVGPTTAVASAVEPAAAAPLRLLDVRGQFADYNAFHTHRANKWTHFVGIPIIVIGIINFLWHLPLLAISPAFTLTAAEPTILLVTAFYVAMNRPLGAAMFVFFVALYAVAIAIGPAIEIALGLFVAGWILQFVGHGVFEKRAPAFTKNGIHLLIGPLWIVNQWLAAFQLSPLQPQPDTPPAPASASTPTE